MTEHHDIMAKVTGAKALEGCQTKCNDKQQIRNALEDLAAQLPSRKVVDLVQSILKRQRSCLCLFERVHQLDSELHDASVHTQGSK